MFARMPRAAGDFFVAPPWLIAFSMILAIVLPAAATAAVPPSPTVDAFDLDALKAAPAAGTDRTSADAAPAPAVAPLPPALATGLAGLTAMAVLRVGRRVYGRR